MSKQNMIIYLCLIVLLINNTYEAVDKELKAKAKMCLILFRLRQHQDPKTIEAILSQLSSLENAKEKVSMFAITHCYSIITMEQVDGIQSQLDKGSSVNSLSKENLQLLSLEDMGHINSDTFSDSIQEFFEVFNELMMDSKIDQNTKQQKEAKDNLVEDDIPFYKSNSFIIIVSIFAINICFVAYQCMMIKKNKNDEAQNQSEVQSKDKSKVSDDKKDDDSSKKKKD